MATQQPQRADSGERPGKRNGGPPVPRDRRFAAIYWMVAILGIYLAQSTLGQRLGPERLPYSEFQRLLRDGKIDEVVISSNQISGKLKAPLDSGKTEFQTARVDTDLVDDLERAGVKYSGRVESSLVTAIVSWVLPTVLFFGLWMLLSRRLGAGPGGGLLAIGKSRAKIFVDTEVKVTFADVAGVDEAKAELQETVAFLKDPAAYGRLGAHMPKGILLVGPPGTGKTLMARAVAGEAGVPFFSISGSEFVEMFVGVGAARVRDLFEQARLKAPCIIFIDELDALGRARGAGGLVGGGHDEKEQTLNQLLVELDGFDPSSGIVLLAATNRPEILDPALLRAGRFDRQVLLDRPDRGAREQILRVHVRKVRMGNVDLAQVAALTPGFTGADLANLVNEAALQATRRGAQTVELSDFTLALERIVAGLEKRSRILSARERRIVAFHELGHALLGAALQPEEPVHKVSIVPRGIGALGYTIQRPSEDRYIVTRDEMLAKMAVLLGGRAAEQVVFSHRSTGGSDDLIKATDLARAMVERYAMSDEVGPVVYAGEQPGFLGLAAVERRGHSEATAREIDQAVRQLVDAAYARAVAMLSDLRPLLDEAAERLIKDETLDEAALAPFLERARASVGPGDRPV